MQQPKEEYGWVLIDTPEKKREMGPVREGDQAFFGHKEWAGWDKSRNIGGDFDPILTYRRPVDVGDGWELVPVGDVIKEGDQFPMGDRWHDCSTAIGLTIGSEKWPANHLCIRRRKKPEAKAEAEAAKWCVLADAQFWFKSHREAIEEAKKAASRTGLPAFVVFAIRKFESKTEILETEL